MAFLSAEESGEVGGYDEPVTTPETIRRDHDLDRAILVDLSETFAIAGAPLPTGVPRFILLESFTWACPQFEILPPRWATLEEMDQWKNWGPIPVEEVKDRKGYIDSIYRNNRKSYHSG